jgi:hypothetical protein
MINKTMWRLIIEDEQGNTTTYNRPTREECEMLLKELKIGEFPKVTIVQVEDKKHENQMERINTPKPKCVDCVHSSNYHCIGENGEPFYCKCPNRKTIANPDFCKIMCEKKERLFHNRRDK